MSANLLKLVNYLVKKGSGPMDVIEDLEKPIQVTLISESFWSDDGDDDRHGDGWVRQWLLRTEDGNYILAVAEESTSAVFCDLYKADRNGKIIDWNELPGSYYGDTDIHKALEMGGFELQDSRKASTTGNLLKLAKYLVSKGSGPMDVIEGLENTPITNVPYPREVRDDVESLRNTFDGFDRWVSGAMQRWEDVDRDNPGIKWGDIFKEVIQYLVEWGVPVTAAMAAVYLAMIIKRFKGLDGLRPTLIERVHHIAESLPDYT